MKRRTLLIIPLLLGALVTVGCMSTLSGESYSRAEARRVQEVQFGYIESVRNVILEGTKTPIGAGAGAAIGGIAGSDVGSGRGSDIAAIAGAVVGGVLGATAEEKMTRRQGIEVTVRLESGRIIAVVQEKTEGVRLLPGDPVRVLSSGANTRVVPR